MKKLIALCLFVSSFAWGQTVVTSDFSGEQCQTLYAGQTIDAGTVCVKVENFKLKVTYTTHNGWELQKTHLWVGSSIGDMPQTRRGNPRIGNFPYHSADITGSTSYTEEIDLGVLGFNCPTDDDTFVVAAHAEVRRLSASGGYETQTGWADGDRFVERGSWGTFFTITLTCNGGGGPEDECETAFLDVKGFASCFLDITAEGSTFNRWGWTNGSFNPGSYVGPLYAGAAGCDTSKGTQVGLVRINYDGSTANLTYTITNTDYTMEETHAFVGNEILPRDPNFEYTVAPGQYPLIHDNLNQVTTDSFSVNGLFGTINVVAHARVCKKKL